MSVAEAILEIFKALPPEKQQQVLSHAERLREETDGEGNRSFKSLRGLWADLGVRLSAEEIDANRKDMWRDFPRQDI